MIYFCCDRLRRNEIAGLAKLNGIDYLEVLDRDAKGTPDEIYRQRRLYLYFINDLNPADFAAANVAIEGGERIRGIAVQSVVIGTGQTAKRMTVDVDKAGDFSTYTLRLLPDANHPTGGVVLDPMYSAVEFSFKVECPSDFDCQPTCDCQPPPPENPEIDYLAKDYGSFRRLMLDRMAQLMPNWRERHEADLGLALVEALAYVGDYLSYQQDAAATEAYLGTARSRISVRRHAKLVDYDLHNGCNARTWVHLRVKQDLPLLPKGSVLCTRLAGQPSVVLPDSPALTQADAFFETLEDVPLYEKHKEMYFHTWGDQRCCLPRGATSATLVDKWPNLKVGDILVFEEVLGPETGVAGDADPNRRWAVRLVDVQTVGSDGKDLKDPLTGGSITQIRWAEADALPFPFCVSSSFPRANEQVFVPDVSVARGNIVLAHHARKVDGGDPRGESLSPVKPPLINVSTDAGCNRCDPPPPAPGPPRYRPTLAQGPLTFSVPTAGTPLFSLATPAVSDAGELDAGKWPADLKAAFTAISGDTTKLDRFHGSNGFWSVGDGTTGYLIRMEGGHLNVYAVPAAASTMLRQDAKAARPHIAVHSGSAADGTDWAPLADLLDCDETDPKFVVEMENDGRAHLRFGDGSYGLAPTVGEPFRAIYRVGNGVAGNVGAESIVHLVTDDAAMRAAVEAVRNPLSAVGGTEPESLEQVRAFAPVAFQTQERAVTEADYAAIAERDPEVQKAQASFCWTGSWRTVFITIDRRNGLPVDAAFKQKMRAFVERFRMAGYDLEIDGPRFVSLEIALEVCVKDGYLRAHVEAVLLKKFSDRVLADGSLGLFHPDNFTFGQTVFLSPLIAAAQEVEGVTAVRATVFRRRDNPTDPQPLLRARLDVGRLEIARCANDPNFAERGTFKVDLKGGL